MMSQQWVSDPKRPKRPIVYPPSFQYLISYGRGIFKKVKEVGRQSVSSVSLDPQR